MLPSQWHLSDAHKVPLSTIILVRKDNIGNGHILSETTFFSLGHKPNRRCGSSGISFENKFKGSTGLVMHSTSSTNHSLPAEAL